MSQKVKGFLASDGKFFESEPECQRHEYAQSLRALCDSHGINPDNFFELLREWNDQIKGWYDADSKCKDQEARATGNINFEPDTISQDQDDREDAPVGDKDAPGFLEQSFGRYK